MTESFHGVRCKIGGGVRTPRRISFLGKAVLKRAGGVEPCPYGQCGSWYGGTAGRCGHRPLRRGLQEVQQNGSSGKSAKRCQWQKKRGGFEEVPRLADTTVAGNRLARRWAREPRPYGALHGVQWVVDVKKLGGFLVNFNHLKILLLFCNFCVAFLIDLCYTKLR